MEYRIEKDTMGEVKVPIDAYYGAQTQRSVENFPIAQDINKMPKEIIRAFAYLKKAAALTNSRPGYCQRKNPTSSARSATRSSAESSTLVPARRLADRQRHAE
jgi:fumarate hydratase class II